jgi:hypothetical protein
MKLCAWVKLLYKTVFYALVLRISHHTSHPGEEMAVRDKHPPSWDVKISGKNVNTYMYVCMYVCMLKNVNTYVCILKACM